MTHAGRHQPGLEQQQQQQQRTPSPLSLLPTDLLGQVFQWIPATGIEGARKDPSRLSVRAACRWLRDAFDSCNTHLVLVGAAAAGSKDSAQRRSYHALLQRLIARTSSLSSLRFKSWENARALLNLPVPWGRLKKLDLSGMPYQIHSASGKPKHQAFGPLVQCSALEELAIFAGCLTMSKPDTLPSCSTLQSLCLLGPSKSDICSIAPLFTALRWLELGNIPGLYSWEGRGLDLASIAACTGICQLSLKLNYFENVNDKMSSLANLTQLTSLKLGKCSVLEDLQPIALLSSLRHLELKEVDSITDISPLVSLQALERLIMTYGLWLLFGVGGMPVVLYAAEAS